MKCIHTELVHVESISHISQSNCRKRPLRSLRFQPGRKKNGVFSFSPLIQAEDREARKFRGVLSCSGNSSLCFSFFSQEPDAHELQLSTIDAFFVMYISDCD